MRCKNCGWPNKPNETNCVKCGTPLTSEDDSDLSIGNAFNTGENEELKGTVREDCVFDSYSRRIEPPSRGDVAEAEEGNKPCPKCGYPLRPGTEKCPNCKFQICGSDRSSYIAVEEPERTKNTTRRPTRIDNGSSGYRGTVNPYMMTMELDPSFVLKPIKRANERHELEELEFEGKSVSLNRDNTEAGNLSITSREQAIITNVDGHWYIEDKSEQKTTFVQAANRIELNDGDLILLGNRLFEFHK